MVKEENKLFICEECGMAYKLKRDAIECEEWCKKYHTCKLDLMKRAIVKR